MQLGIQNFGGPGYPGYQGFGFFNLGQLSQSIMKYLFIFSIIGGVVSFLMGNKTGLGLSVFFCVFSIVFITESSGPWRRSATSTSFIISFVVGVVAALVAIFLIPLKTEAFMVLKF